MSRKLLLTTAISLLMIQPSAMALITSTQNDNHPPDDEPIIADQTQDDAQDNDTADEGEKSGEKKKNQLSLDLPRTVTIATDEGTWLSLDLSPDGNTIIFELLGEIFSMPATGGNATLIVTSAGFDSQPKFSPDGQKMTFLSDRDGGENVWIANADGSDPKPLSKGKNTRFASPVFSADGDYVIVSKTGAGLAAHETWMYHTKGGSGIQLTKAKAQPNQAGREQKNTMGAVPSPDGKYLYYATKRGGFEYNQASFNWAIARRDLNSGLEDVIITTQGGAMKPILSPDGTKLVYGTRFDSQTGLRIRNLLTGKDDWLLYPITRDDQESRFSRDLLPNGAFTPDGGALLINLDGKIQRVDIETASTSIIPFQASLTQSVGPDLDVAQRVETGPVQVRLMQEPSLSPDGKRIAFSALGELYVHTIQSNRTVKLGRAGDSAFHPAWSPDGNTLAYVSWNNGTGHIWTIGANGGRVRQLTKTPAYYGYPRFTRDGRTLVGVRASADLFLRRESEFGPTQGQDLISIPARGGDVNFIKHASGVTSPHFAGDDDRIYYYGGGALKSVRLDGIDERTHLKVTTKDPYRSGRDAPADEIRMSPNGKWALVHAANQLHLVAAPRFDDKGASVKLGGANVATKQLTDIGADSFGWSADGSSIHWAVGMTFHEQNVDTLSFDNDKKDEDKKDEDKDDETKEDTNNESSTPENEEKNTPPVLKEDHEDVRSTTITVEVPRDVPQGSILLSGGKVVTMSTDDGQRQVIAQGDVLITENKIAAIGATGTLDVPANTKTIDVTGKTLLPGFVDSHAHWRERRRSVVEKNPWTFLINLAYGVTAGLDVQTSGEDIFAYQDAIDAGRSLGPRAYSTGRGVFSSNLFKSEDHVYGVLKKYRDHYRTRNIKAYVSGNRQQRQWVIAASKKLGMLPTTEGSLDLKLNITHAQDGFWGNEHSLPITPLYKDIVQLYAQTNTAYTPTLLVAYGGPWGEEHYFTTERPHNDPKARRFMPHSTLDRVSLRRRWFEEQEHVFPKLAADAKQILEAGGRVGVGSHGQIQGLAFHWEMWALASGGMSPTQVLRSATIMGADIIGFEKDIGSIEVGKFADINIFNEDPTVDIRNSTKIGMVMKNGRVYNADTMAQIAPLQTDAPKLWFHTTDPEPRK